MKVRYKGANRTVEAWKDQNNKRDYNLKNGAELNIGVWCGMESIVTNEGEWICDKDSPCCKNEFEIIE